MKKLLLFVLSIIWTTSALSQVTTGYHRVNQLLSRGTSGVTAQVVPRAVVHVTSTATGLNATIYRDPLLTSQITSGSVTSDSVGNYDYYIPLNYCVDETTSAPGQGSIVISNVCLNYPSIPLASAVVPIVDGTGAVGTSTAYARADHVHPTDTSRVSTSTTVNGHALGGNVVVSASDLTTGTLPHAQLPALLSADIPSNAANTSGNAGTASALATAPSQCSTGYAPVGIMANGNATGCAAIGGGGFSNPMTTLGDIIYENATPTPARLAGPTGGTGTYVLEDVTASGVATAETWSVAATGSGAPVLAVSPSLTGTPTAPTAPNGTNTTQIATTAFVQSSVVIASATYAFSGTLSPQACIQFGLSTLTTASSTTPLTISLIGTNTALSIPLLVSVGYRTDTASPIATLCNPSTTTTATLTGITAIISVI